MSNNIVFELSSLPYSLFPLLPQAMYPSKQLRNRLNEEPATMDYNTQYMLRRRLKAIKSMAETYGLRYTKTNLRAFVSFPDYNFGHILIIHLCKPDEGKPAFEFELNKCGLWPAQGKMDIELTAVKSEQICNNKYNGEYTVFDINMNKLNQWLGDARMVYELYVVEQHKKDIRSAAGDLAEIVGKAAAK